MRIGLDFDNTIVSYDALFHKVAVERGAIPADLPGTKIAVREYLRASGREDLWTEMQGHVYGARMDEAAAYPGALEFLKWAAGQAAVFIISHKTRYPFAGARHDLHQAARSWVERHLKDGELALVRPENVFFELTQKEKIERIRTTACRYYVDDLPEILLSPDFPADAERILFDPEGHHRGNAGPLRPARSWQDLLRYFRQECRIIR